MRKILFLLFLTFVLSGCATYKFQKPATSSAGGYLACYNGKPISEYTVGKEKTLPDLTLAKERFKRRRSTVEYYYKQMDQIESRLKEFFWEPPVMIVGFLGGVLRWPFIAVADYKYNHNPKYKARVDRRDEEKETLETARIVRLKKELNAYIAKDLAKESGGQGVVAAPALKSQPEVLPASPELLQPAPVLPVIQEVIPKTETSPVNPETASEPLTPSAATAAVAQPPVAVIIAQPVKGYAPLKVNFSGQKSHSKSGKIISYLWDFGDGDTSTQKNPENTYWSTTFGSRSFTVTLTVRDQAGSVSSTTSIIEVTTR
ncbi:MAG: PKD domain-containing protein [Candidatus Omnitrophota bacterium]|nr:PKD domain-containing protein [Candidatus Omnitrophota bacterium]